MTHLLALAPTLLAATSKSSTKSSSNVTFLLFIVVIVGALYFLFLRPNQQRARKAREESASIGVGDRVVTIGGIVGTIIEMQNDRVVLMSANPGVDGEDVAPTRLVMLRSAIARKVDVGAAATPADEAVDQSDAVVADDDEADGESRE